MCSTVCYDNKGNLKKREEGINLWKERNEGSKEGHNIFIRTCFARGEKKVENHKVQSLDACQRFSFLSLFLFRKSKQEEDSG